MRLCGPCLDSVFETYGGNWQKADLEAELSESSLCAACETLIAEEEPHALFATLYRRGSEREDWYALYCLRCALGLVDAFKLE